MATKDELKQLWVGWTRDAMSRYEMPTEIDDAEELVDEMIDVVTDYADGMLEEYENRFEAGPKRKRKKGKRADPDDDDDDPDDD